MPEVWETPCPLEGLTLGQPLALWPGQRLLQTIDLRLPESRFALVIVSREFLKFSHPRKELDGLTIRRKVVTLLAGVTETVVAAHSPRLAVAAMPGSLDGELARLFQQPGGSS